MTSFFFLMLNGSIAKGGGFYEQSKIGDIDNLHRRPFLFQGCLLTVGLFINNE